MEAMIGLVIIEPEEQSVKSNNNSSPHQTPNPTRMGQDCQQVGKNPFQILQSGASSNQSYDKTVDTCVKDRLLNLGAFDVQHI